MIKAKIIVEHLPTGRQWSSKIAEYTEDEYSDLENKFRADGISLSFKEENTNQFIYFAPNILEDCVKYLTEIEKL